MLPVRNCLCFGLAFALSLMIVVVPASADDVRQQLKTYKGTTAVIRDFYRDAELHFDSDGLPLGRPGRGIWTVDGVVGISDIRMGKHGLEIKVRRAYAALKKKKFDLVRSDRTATIEVDMDPDRATLAQVHLALRKIFLNPDDRFADLVPDFWRFCFESGPAAPPGIASRCQLAPSLAALIEDHSPRSVSPNPAPEAGSKEAPAPFTAGHGITPPRAISAPDPSYSEVAREERIQGTMVLQLVVDASGQPTDIVIVSPIGYGLDELAVGAVRTWRFTPAQKDGQPVRVVIAVEVAFHLT